MKCLVVIDMQWYFSAARPDWLIANIVEKIEQYIVDNQVIVIVEYTDEDNNIGMTVPEILKAIRDYDKVYFVHKRGDDGGKEIDDLIKGKELHITEFEVCGVNLGCCVAETVCWMGYEYEKTPINVILDCCNSEVDMESGIDHFYGIVDYDGKRHNVELVGCIDGGGEN